MVKVYSEESGKLRTYGRVKTRKLRSKQERLMEELFPKISLGDIEEYTEGKKLTNPRSLFENQNTDKKYQNICLEIGFGFGEHISQMAIRNPNDAFIGCETHVNGVARLIEYIDESNIQNIRIFNGDTRILIENLENNSLDKIFILFPDPWPKKRHHKRRLISHEFLDLIHIKLSKDGILIFASDHAGYREWVKEHIEENKNFDIERIVKMHSREEIPSDWIKTRYQEKGFEEDRGSEAFYIKPIK